MPLFDVKCDKCGEIQRDVFVRFNMEDIPIKCASCDGEMKKTVSSSNFFLKGSGWERDGYGSK